MRLRRVLAVLVATYYQYQFSDQKSSPKCKHGVTNGNNLEPSKWREGMKCPKCWKEFTADHGRPPDSEQEAVKPRLCSLTYSLTRKEDDVPSYANIARGEVIITFVPDTNECLGTLLMRKHNGYVVWIWMHVWLRSPVNSAKRKLTL